MISKKELKEYDFLSINDFFNYIIESKINGNYTQVDNLIKKLSKKQLKSFINFVVCHCENNNDVRYCYEIAMDLI